ncbi:MAG TPA: polysaccharide biosynthesis/export family protein [Bryobacteraceae bacterium]|jgi:polysaccharide export outer membrane protein
MKTFLSAALLTVIAVEAQTGALEQRDPHYRLQREDKIDVQYRFTPEYNASVSVQPDGYVSLPLVGELKAAGLTLDEVTQAIRAKANITLNDPEVMVLLRDYLKPYFVLAGEVARPGRVEMHGPVTLIEAIALGGGFKDTAKRTQVVLLRKTSGEMAEVKVFDVRKLMSRSGIGEDIPVRPGDMLVVPRNGISKVEPYVRLADAGLYGLAAKYL